MPDGVRAELAVHVPAACPLVPVSSATGARVTDVTWTSTPDGEVTEQFRAAIDGTDPPTPEGAEAVVDLGDERVYQFTREGGAGCVCEVVEGLGYPIADTRVDDGVLALTLHLPSLSDLRAVVDRLEAAAEEVEVRYLVQQGGADGGEGAGRPAVVDLGELTDRQREVLETAYGMGYFDYPREANATEVATALDIDVSTFVEHLTVAQSKLLGDVVGG